MNLRGKTALVTGAGRRIGKAIAGALAEGGADVLLHTHSASGNATRRMVERLGRRAYILRADLARPSEAVRLAEDALAMVTRVDILVNNAAVFLPTPIQSLSEATWRQIVNVNLTAPYLLAMTLGRVMCANGAGKIIQMGDWSGQRPTRGYLAYCVSKGGLHALTVALAKALAPEVQVNEIALGPVLPPAAYEERVRRELEAKTPLRRLGSIPDVTRAVRFLIEGGDFVTGATYAVDGGWLASEAGGTGISL